MPEEMCSCGEPLHYTKEADRLAMESMIELAGPTVVITTSAGSWRVPRHYAALHGIVAAYLPALAQRYGWERVGRPGDN